MNTKTLGAVVAGVAGLVALYWATRPRGTVPGVVVDQAPAPTFADVALGMKAPKGSAVTPAPSSSDAPNDAAAVLAAGQGAYVPGTYDGGTSGYLAPIKTDWTPDQLAQTFREEVGAAYAQQTPMY